MDVFTVDDMLNDRLIEVLNEISEHDAGSKERRACHEEVMDLAKLQLDNRRLAEEYNDKAERRRIEENKNLEASEVEKGKQRIGLERWVFEFLKLGLTIGIGTWSYFKAQRTVLDFEEHGRITSTAGRELHLPKLTWWK